MDSRVALRVLSPTISAVGIRAQARSRFRVRLPFLARFLRRPPLSNPRYRVPPSFSSLSLSHGLAGDGVAVGEAGRAGRFASSASFTAVLLGWLGAEERHLKRYAEMYRSRGMRVMTLVIGPGELLRLDLGKAVERRIAGFTSEIVEVVTEEEEREGRESFLLFHTFSNTGWLTYGAILDNLQTRADIIEKIKGCIVDSGADPNIDPKVWAAGFCAALLKKSSSSLPSTNSSTIEELTDNIGNGVYKQDNKSHVAEMLFLAVLQTLFTCLLKLPDVTRRLERVISILSKRQPLCPQLYLYSSADKVIPFSSVESFVEEQKATGRNVRAYNFFSSPHVDHLRTFPDVYSGLVGKFLEECLVVVVDSYLP